MITDDREAQVGRKLRGEMDRTPVGSIEHIEAHKAYVEAMRAFRNQPGGFWVASANPGAADEALTGALPRHEVCGLALMSDGATRLVDRFGLLSWSELTKMLAAQGPKKLLKSVRAAEDSDPAGQRWPRGKARDDATAAYIQPEGTRPTQQSASLHCSADQHASLRLPSVVKMPGSAP